MAARASQIRRSEQRFLDSTCIADQQLAEKSTLKRQMPALQNENNMGWKRREALHQELQGLEHEDAVETQARPQHLQPSSSFIFTTVSHPLGDTGSKKRTIGFLIYIYPARRLTSPL